MQDFIEYFQANTYSAINEILIYVCAACCGWLIAILLDKHDK